MKVMVVGGGGREHALAWKLAQSPKVESILAAPGNPGIAELPKCECVALNLDDLEKVADFAEDNGIELTVVGPEATLVAGIADVFKRRGLPVFGPSKAAAQLEGSKAFSKELMSPFRHTGIAVLEYFLFLQDSTFLFITPSLIFPIFFKA